MRCEDCAHAAATVNVLRQEGEHEVVVRRVCPACARAWDRPVNRLVHVELAAAPPAPFAPAKHSGVPWCLGPGEVCPPAPRLWGRHVGDQFVLEVGGAEGERKAAGWEPLT